jgi:hypothetical protein
MSPLDRNEAIRLIRAALKKRSGKSWSVRGGRGTTWGLIYISSPARRREFGGGIVAAEREELAKLLALESVGIQGVSIPASLAYRQEYIARAEGRVPSVFGNSF